MKKIIIIIILTGFAFLLVAQNSMVLDTKVVGNSNIETDLIKSLLNLEIGEELTRENVSQSIKNLYQLGVFDDVQIDVQAVQNGVKIVVLVEEFPIVSTFKFDGNKKIKDSRFEEILDIQEGMYWSPFLQSEIANAISKEYKTKGYHLVKIEFVTEKTANNELDLIIQIEENTKVFVRKINLFGNKLMREKKILKKMKTKKKALFHSGKFEQETFDEDLVEMISHYNKKGFIDARILSWDKRLVNGEFVLDIYLFEGEIFHFGEVVVSGNEYFMKESIVEKFTFDENDIFDLEKFNEQLGAANSMYYEEGFIYANFGHEIEKSDNKVNIKITIKENNRAKVRKINIVGNRKTKEKIIRHQLAISPGDYFQQSKIMKSQQNIYNLGFFEPDLHLENPEVINQNGDVDLTFVVNDKTLGSANGGISYNVEDGIVGNLSVGHNNLFGNAWQSTVKWEFGGKTQNFTLNFTNPYFKDTNSLIGFDVYHTTRESEAGGYKVATRGGSFRFGRPLSFLNRAKLVMGYSLYNKKYDLLEDTTIDVSESLDELAGKGWQNTSSLSLTFSRDSRNNIFFPTAGSNFTIYSEVAGGMLQGDFNYYKQVAQVSWYVRTIWKLALRTKWRAGYVTHFGESNDVPVDERFYLGGTGIDGIRGWADRSVGPVTGSLREVIFSTEYAAPIGSDQIIGLIFFDAGNGYEKFERFNFWDMKTGAGAGIRVNSPFGLIGFDYAWNFETGEWVPHFQFGTTF